MKRVYPLYAIIVLIIALTSCKKSNSIKPNPGRNLTLSAVELQKASADNTFSLNLFKTVSSGNTAGSNLFISPLSVSMAMGMTSNGANGQTLKDIDSAMNFNGFTQDQINTYYNTLLTQLPELDPNTTLKIANSIWYRQGFSVSSQFLQTDSNYFHAKVQSLDFMNPSSTNTINDWVNAQTNGKIQKIVSQITPDNMMFLINAIYFKSIWANKFDPSQTVNKPFLTANNSEVQTPFMHGNINCNYHSDADATLLELPYSNNKYSMMIVLPNGNKTLNDIISEVSSDTWQNWTSQLQAYNANLYMPKFQFSYSIKLNNALTNLGMGIAFSSLADFSRISTATGLQITEVDHKAYINVDESGTTAAAATSVVIGFTSVAPQPVISVDHPFLFVIREMKTGLILFIGTVNDPTQIGSQE